MQQGHVARRGRRLSRFVQRRNRHTCPCVATAHRLLRQRSVRQHRTAARERSLLQRRTACCSSAQQIRATTQPTLLPIRCSAPCVLQQRSAGSCDDATDTVAHPLQQRIACCNSAQCDNAELLHESTVCCNSATRVATALSMVVQRRNQQLFPSVAVAHACCNSAPYHNAATCCNAGQPGVAQPNLLQRSTCCNAGQPVATDHSPLQPVAAIAMLCDPLQPTTACCNLLQRCSQYSVCRSNPARCKAAQPVATDHSSLPWAKARCNLLQRSQRSAFRCNRSQAVAIDHDPLQQTTACCNRLQR